jgi:glycosyltransferase involved in cell wall biosynthesis
MGGIMRVLFVIPSVAPVRGGPSQAVLETVKALQIQGMDVEIVTTNDNGQDLLDVPLQQRTIYQDVPVWFFPRYSPDFAPVREFAFSSEFTKWLWHSISKYDLIHVHAIFSYTSTVAMSIARLKKIPFIISPFGMLCTWSLQQSYREKQIYLNLIERSNLNHATAIHFTAPSEQQEAEVLQLKAPSFILPHGLDAQEILPNARQLLREKLNLPTHQKIILFFSRLHHKKGLKFLIPALAQFLDRDFSFVIAGSGESEFVREIESLLDSHHLKERSHLVGFVSGVEKEILLQGADLFALTSYSENFGIAVLEALRAGTPALVTPGIALASVVEANQVGYVSGELSVEAISLQLKESFDQSESEPLVRDMSDRACKLIAESYTWKSIAKQLVETYSEIT